MSFFNLPCLAPQTAKKLLILSSILLILTGFMDFAYTAVQAQQIKALTKYTQSTGVAATIQIGIQNSKEITPLAVYFGVAGFVEVVSSVIILLVLLDVLGKSGRSFWINLLLALSILNFGCNFAIAIYSSVTSSLWEYKHKDLMDPNYMLTGDWVDLSRTMVRFLRAEAVITFILNLPLAGLVILGLLSKSLKQEGDSGSQGQHNLTTDQLNKKVVHPN